MSFLLIGPYYPSRISVSERELIIDPQPRLVWSRGLP